MNKLNDTAKLKKESEKARKALCKENEKKRKEKQKLLVVIVVKLPPPPLPTRMNFLQYLSHKVYPNLIKILSFDLVFVALMILLLLSTSTSCSRKSSRFEFFLKNSTDENSKSNGNIYFLYMYTSH